jgi:hypothetical protein
MRAKGTMRILRSLFLNVSGLHGWSEVDSHCRLVGFFQRDALGIKTFETNFDRAADEREFAPPRKSLSLLKGRI